MKARNIIITIISNVITIIVCIYLLKQLDLKKNDWEKAKNLNLTNYQGGYDISYNITDVIKNNQKLCESLQKLKKTLF